MNNGEQTRKRILRSAAREEGGAIIVEAVLALSLLMFAVVTVYSMFHVALLQARIGTALNETAREISAYGYIYDLSGLKDKQANLNANSGAAENTMSDAFGEINGLFDALKGIGKGISSATSSADSADSFLYYALNQGIEVGKGWITGELARLLMKKHFGASPDKFLKRNGIEKGMRGLSFWKSTVFADGEEDNIFLDCQYQVVVVKLLDINIKFNFELCAKTRAWVGTN